MFSDNDFPSHMESTSPRLPKLQPWYWTAPRIAIGLFVLAVIALLWLLHRQELEEQRSGLIGDTLWVEQNLQFNLSRSQEHLQQLGQDYFTRDRPDENFSARIRSFELSGTLPVRRRVHGLHVRIRLENLCNFHWRIF
jgi:hypothetical protein